MVNNITTFPEGFNAVKDEMLVFLPEDEAVRSGFMLTLLQFLIQW